MRTIPGGARSEQWSRRQVLRSLCGGAAAVSAASAVGLSAVSRAAQAATRPFTLPGRFGRMFHLPPFAPPTDAVRAALLELGKPGGIMDARDDLGAGPVALIADPALSVTNRNSPAHPAGTTFIGQFLDHDMTFDTRSRLGHATPPIVSRNARTPAFDLDSVYGEGPAGSPQLYDPSDRIKFRVESGGLFEDLPRSPGHNAAIIADPRNDEHLILAGVHAAFLLFHNNLVDVVRSHQPGVADDDAFAESSPTCHLALPVGDPPRDPAALRRAGAGSRPRWRAGGASTFPAGTGHSCPWSSRSAIASGTAWCARRTGPTWPATTGSRSSA